MSTASKITRKAKSNLAFALAILPRDRREDMVVFYAFCRTMDDLADDLSLPAAQRKLALESWQSGLTEGFPAPDEFQREVVALRDRRSIPNDLLLAVIQGCMMDLQPQRFQTRDDLSGYIWKVACAVGLVSIRLFGCREKASEPYAIALGHALQLTNILRDVGEDLENGGRIYLPLADVARFHLSESDLAARVRDDRFLALMDDQADLAERYFQQAEEILPATDRRALLPARIMAEIYRTLLRDMRTDRFRVFEKRYRISKARKFAILAKHLIARSR